MLNYHLLWALCETPTQSRREHQMIAFIKGYCLSRGWRVDKDAVGNLKVTTGIADSYLAVCAHIDSVQPVERSVKVRLKNDIVLGYDNKHNQVGFGADDKTGVYVCLELLGQMGFPMVAFFFVGEEICMMGAERAPKHWFKKIRAVIEFDCPARYMVSYSCGGTRLFKNDSEFARTIVPVLRSHKFTHWQHHPYTDVKMLRQRFPIPCLNISSGYYNWHSHNEYIRLSELEASLVVGHDLLRALIMLPPGALDWCPVGFDIKEDGEPAERIEGLRVINEHVDQLTVRPPSEHSSLTV